MKLGSTSAVVGEKKTLVKLCIFEKILLVGDPHLVTHQSYTSCYLIILLPHWTLIFQALSWFIIQNCW